MPEDDDIYVPASRLLALRDGQAVNIGMNVQPWTGIGIDYTHTAMTNIHTGLPNTSDRVLLGVHGTSLIEIFDLVELEEVDFIDDPWSAVTDNPAQLEVTTAGLAITGWYGNGYLFVAGEGTLPAFLNTVSNTTAMSEVKTIAAWKGNSQTGAPFAFSAVVPSPQITAAWAIAYDEATDVLFYTSGGFYVPVGGTQIKRYHIGSSTQLPNFATLSLVSGINPGLKGIALLPDGGLLVCNGPVVQRLNSVGAIVHTYTPSIAMDSTVLTDLVLVFNDTRFWVFDILTGAEYSTVQTYLEPGSFTQLARYGASSSPVPVTTNLLTIRRLRRAPHLSTEQLWNFYAMFQLDLETGVGLTTGQGSDPQIMLRYSDDGGHTWSNEIWVSAGALGQYARRAIWRRLGRSRDRVFEVTYSEPTKFALVNAYLDVTGGTS
jgi:hypothetical protein